jgi:hypothetical protein
MIGRATRSNGRREHALDGDFSSERAMHRTLVRDLEHAHALGVGEISVEMNDAIERVDVVFIFLRQLDLDARERNIFETRIRTDGHRRARAESSEQKVERVGSDVVAFGLDRLVGQELVRTDLNDLSEFPIRGAHARGSHHSHERGLNH